MNPYLQQLGFQADDRVVVVHADDIGMCHATLPAIDELMAFGLVTSASAMVPCPWFLEAASWPCPWYGRTCAGSTTVHVSGGRAPDSPGVESRKLCCSAID